MLPCSFLPSLHFQTSHGTDKQQTAATPLLSPPSLFLRSAMTCSTSTHTTTWPRSPRRRRRRRPRRCPWRPRRPPRRPRPPTTRPTPPRRSGPATRHEIQAAIAKATELRALHAALLQGQGAAAPMPGARTAAAPPRRSSASAWRVARALQGRRRRRRRDYPVFTPVSNLSLSLYIYIFSFRFFFSNRGAWEVVTLVVDFACSASLLAIPFFLTFLQLCYAKLRESGSACSSFCEDYIV